MTHLITQIWINEACENELLVQRILGNLPDLPRQIIKQADFEKTMEDFPLESGKKILYLTKTPGPKVKPCPATNNPYLCCQYTTINQITQCPMDCTYCILQHFLDNPIITIYVDYSQIFEEIFQLQQEQPKRFFRFGTGELGDSLVLDSITELSKDYLSFFKDRKNCVIELKTKSIDIDYVLQHPIKNGVISWSLNPQTVIEKDEKYAAGLEQRLKSAQKCQDAGFLLGFHFDPILSFNGWQTAYESVVEQIFKSVDGSRIAWISLGSLRFPPALHHVIQDRFPQSKIIYEEMIRGMDGKQRYPRPLRVTLYQHLVQQIRKHNEDVFLYFCMESAAVWDRVFGMHPEDNGDLDFWFAKSMFDRFPELDMHEPDRMDYPTL